MKDEQPYTSKDFATDQEVRWCPGCGDYGILKQVRDLMPELGLEREKTVFISGIGCSSRFPYYMNTYGLHSIHGRATSLATGLKMTRSDLSVWIITGDGDGMSIGGNHLIHLLRRNPNVNILLFNNEIYGLTKGQFSPTSEQGKHTRSSPWGTVDHPFNLSALALGADASFFARTVDRESKHLRETLRQAHEHKGASLVEIYQNCNVFNDGTFSAFTDKEHKQQNVLHLEEGAPLSFGDPEKPSVLTWKNSAVSTVERETSDPESYWIHDPYDRAKAHALSRLSDDMAYPRPFGVLYKEDRAVYEELLAEQERGIAPKRTEEDLDALISGDAYWQVGQ